MTNSLRARPREWADWHILPGKLFGRNDRNLLPPVRRQPDQEGPAATVFGLHGSESPCGDSRRTTPMEGTGANGMGPEGSVLRSPVGRMAGPHTARFTRCAKA